MQSDKGKKIWRLIVTLSDGFARFQAVSYECYGRVINDKADYRN